MQTLDLIIIFGYLIGVTAFGSWFGTKQKTTEDYFVGDRSVPWWAIAASIVATETSTITFISVPGIAFAKNGNFQFLQLVFGYIRARNCLVPFAHINACFLLFVLFQRLLCCAPCFSAASFCRNCSFIFCLSSSNCRSLLAW